MWYMTYMCNTEKKDRESKEILWPIHGDSEKESNTSSFAMTSKEMIEKILKNHGVTPKDIK